MFKLLPLLFLLVFSQSSYSRILVIGLETPSLHQKNKQGRYDRILVQAFKKLHNVEYKIYPLTRGDFIFNSCVQCCISPGDGSSNSNLKNRKYSVPFGEAKLFIFVPSDKPVKTTVAELRGLSVGVTRGQDYFIDFEEEKIITHPVNTIEQNIRKLESGRIDALLAYTPDIYAEFSRLKMEPLPHNKQHPLFHHQDRLTCKGVSVEFMQTINNVIIDSKK